MPALEGDVSGTYAYTTGMWPPVIAAVFLIGIILHAWQHRQVHGARTLAAGAILCVVWLLAMAAEEVAVSPATKLMWHKIQALPQVSVATATVCFALEYTYPGRWLTLRNVALLSIVPMVSIFAVLTNDARLVWSILEVAPNGSLVMRPAPLGLFLLVYAFAIVLVNATAFIWLFIRSRQHRWPVLLILVGEIGSRGVYVSATLGLSKTGLHEPLVLAIVFSWAMYAIALFGFRIFDPLVAARQRVIEQMQAGLVVFDAHWTVASLNPAAERILGTPAGAARGKTWQQLRASMVHLPALADPSAARATATIEYPETTIGNGSEARHYAPSLSPMKDFRGLLVGYVLMLRDITERKRAQTQILEQQRSLAMLRERERLARELHDGIGQVLGYASMQADAAYQLIEIGQPEAAQTQLSRLAGVLRDAHADVREQILSLRAAPSQQRPFFDAVKHYLDGFSANYDVQTELTLAGGLGADPFSPETQMQLFRILQEALSNARRHSGAHRIWVTFDAADGVARMSVEDDGRGFDVRGVAGADAGHFGLAFMRERAETLGGRLHVESAAGRGARVTVEMPRGER
jgi:PAS domain S-box-containing protein